MTGVNPYTQKANQKKSADGKALKVVVAMSGGVDSSVAALLLKQQGYEVMGIALQVTDYSKYRKDDTGGTCCSIKDIEDARRVAEAIGIPFYVVDTEKVFDTQVVDYFVNEYLQGHTPNPCVMCNTKVKFNELYKKALDMGADFVATGHYAKVSHDVDLGYILWRARDEQKDQSYFLFNLTQRQLARTLFPLGNLNKTEVRKIAEEHNIPVAVKPDSQEICFVPGNNYVAFIEDRTAPTQRRKGLIVDALNNLFGPHDGIHHYTIGQRKGIGEALERAKQLSIPECEDFVVVKIDPIKNLVYLGPERLLKEYGLIASRVNWVVPPDLRKPRRLSARIRHRGEMGMCEVVQLGDSQVEVRFTEAQKAVSPGQAIVFYDGNMCVGGGWIHSSLEVAERDRPRLNA